MALLQEGHLMKRAKPVHQNQRPADAIDEIVLLNRTMTGPLPDQEMNKTLGELYAATVALTHIPSQTAGDLNHKLDILCQRLREFLDPTDRGGVLTALLAHSIQDDLKRLA